MQHKITQGSRRHPNQDERWALKVAEFRTFTVKYGRSAQKGVEPNDRCHDRDVERLVKRMHPIVLDKLLRDED